MFTPSQARRCALLVQLERTLLPLEDSPQQSAPSAVQAHTLIPQGLHCAPRVMLALTLLALELFSAPYALLADTSQALALVPACSALQDFTPLPQLPLLLTLARNAQQALTSLVLACQLQAVASCVVLDCTPLLQLHRLLPLVPNVLQALTSQVLACQLLAVATSAQLDCTPLRWALWQQALA